MLYFAYSWVNRSIPLIFSSLPLHHWHHTLNSSYITSKFFMEYPSCWLQYALFMIYLHFLITHIRLLHLLFTLDKNIQVLLGLRSVTLDYDMNTSWLWLYYPGWSNIYSLDEWVCTLSVCVYTSESLVDYADWWMILRLYVFSPTLDVGVYTPRFSYFLHYNIRLYTSRSSMIYPSSPNIYHLIADTLLWIQAG